MDKDFYLSYIVRQCSSPLSSLPPQTIYVFVVDLIIYSYIVKWRPNDSVLAFFCRSKSMWNWGTRLFSNAGSSSCEFRMFCIFLLIVYHVYYLLNDEISYFG
jgi:hypothetical protein